MSADSPHRSRSQTRGASTVAPQEVTDPTILDSVAGFINEVVPVAYNNAPCEIEDKIQWAHLEELEYDPEVPHSLENEENLERHVYAPPPLLLVLGYSTGIQIWALPVTGEATEVLSWRHSSVRCLRFIQNPTRIGSSRSVDLFAASRPLVALCDSSTNYTALTFRSLKSGTELVKQIQFKSSILNVLANRHSIVVAFTEKIAIFDAFSLESRVSITTCFLSPGLQPNPIALGSRWLAYAEKKLINANRSGGGNDGEGVQSYTATVLQAAKTITRSFKELKDVVAGSLGGTANYKAGTSPNSPQAGGPTDILQKGVITIVDIENKSIDSLENIIPHEAVIAHFVAHTEAVVALSFDPSGMLLLTADKRGHNFHVFRIHPHPGGPALASVHHLYTLHRGDTSAKVQDMCFSPDSRWVAVSTLRGTTHVFPITPYGGHVNVRTHGNPLVVNKMSRYQRSAGLTSDGRSSSPVAIMDTPVTSLLPYRNPRFPPFLQPTVVQPLAQIRQPVYVQNTTGTQQRAHPGDGVFDVSGRQRLSSSSEENISLRVVACFAPPRAWIDSTKVNVETNTYKQPTKPVESLFIMSCYGTLVQYDLDPQPISSVPKERVCNDTAIELKVEAKAQWTLHRHTNHPDIPLPMSRENLKLIIDRVPLNHDSKPDPKVEKWLAEVEIVTHLGPHRRLWMGPQFTFKTYTVTNGTVVETRSVDVGRSKPVNMPVSKANAILIESGSASSCEQLYLDTYHPTSDEVGSAGELRLKEDLADAMLESPGIRNSGGGGHCVIVSMKPHATTKVVNPLGTVVTVHSDDETEVEVTEDEAVIHENCDEALFRPIVTQKSIFYADSQPKPCPPDNILTKSLDTNTEVAVRIINRQKDVYNRERNKKAVSSKSSANHSSSNNNYNNNNNKSSKSRESSPKPVTTCTISTITTTTSTTTTSSTTKANKSKDNSKIKGDSNKARNCKIVADFSDFEEQPPKQTKLVDFDILTLETPPPEAKVEVVELEFPSPPIFATPEPSLLDPIIAKPDRFEDAEDCGDKLISSGLGSCETNNSSEEEKIVTKKTRKPKTKLGVKIAPVNKEKLVDVVEPPVIAPPPKRSWNVVVASKPPEKIKELDLIENEPSDVVVSDINFVEHFTFKLPKKDSENLIDIVFKDEAADHDTTQVKNDLEEDFNLMKLDKSSDDEKGDNGSSPAETTTESDDSSKVPVTNSIIDLDDDNVVSTQSNTCSKSSKKKSRKKRK